MNIDQQPRKCSKKDIKGKDRAHPRSRKAEQMQRILIRQDRLADRKRQHNLITNYPVLDRVTWFQMALDPSAEQVADLHAFVKEYLDRHSSEIEQIKKDQRPGRPLPKRYSDLMSLCKQERSEYETGAGLLIPNLIGAEQVQKLRNWDGHKESLDRIGLLRLKKSFSLMSQ